MKLYVIRHGETELGKKHLIATVDEPLNKTGITQAINVGKELRDLDIDIIYCSPIERAKHTLSLFDLDKDIPVIFEDRIKERDMGIYDNIPFDSLDWDVFWNYNSGIKYPELETMRSVYKRIKAFLDEIKNNNKNVLLVTHGGVSRAIYWYFNGIPKNGNSSNVNENCKVYEYTM
jgi:probable phosphoglycerate mutase